jgi:hypothetical protein
MAVSDDSLRLALRNIARYGDTDVFPFPLETHWFHDEEDVVVQLLKEMDANFDAWVADYPVLYVRSLSSVGYWGFRACTQIDPLWNAYLLALAVHVGGDVERARIGPSRGIIHSYRYAPDAANSMLFDRSFGWASYQQQALATATGYEYVLSTDISDFYARVYHHRLENALSQATPNKEAVKRIMVLLLHLAAHTSYGLPVGGNASRLLAELLLNRTDRLLVAERVRFERFVDDYYLFCESREVAQRSLTFLSDTLLKNEGLGLSRSKTRLMTQAEFNRSSPAAAATVADADVEAESRSFLRIRLTFDQYSPNAEDEYDELKSEVEKHDILAMLAREFEKSRVDEVVVRQLIKAVRFIDAGARNRALVSIVNNIEKLYPVFPTVSILLRRLLNDMEPSTKEAVFGCIRDLLHAGSHIMLVPTNLAFAVRILSHDTSEDTDVLLSSLYASSGTDMMIKRDVILAMTKRRVSYWLSDVLRRYSVVSPWEKRALIVSSYVLGDEGRHWRDWIRPQLSVVDTAFMRWVGTKYNGRTWDVPL